MAVNGITEETGYAATTQASTQIKVSAAAGQKEPRKKIATESEAKSERTLPDVVSMSEDGDTVQASKPGIDRLEEDENVGRVVVKNKEQAERPGRQGQEEDSEAEAAGETQSRKSAIDQVEQAKKSVQASQVRRRELAERRMENAERAREAIIERLKADELAKERKETNSEQTAQLSNFVGFSDSEMERLYLTGAISKADYDKEMEQRADREESIEKESRTIEVDTLRSIAISERAERDSMEMKLIFSENSSSRLKPEQRAEIVDTLEDFPLKSKNDLPEFPLVGYNTHGY